MSTIRVSKDKNYSVINNTVLNDTRLSWKAKGLAAYLLSKPDDWKIVREHLINQSDDGETAVRTALKELETFGYLVRTRRQDEAGRFEWEHTLYETPRECSPLGENPPVDKPQVDNPPVDNPLVENQALLSTDVVNTDNKDTPTVSATQTISPPSLMLSADNNKTQPQTTPVTGDPIQEAVSPPPISGAPPAPLMKQFQANLDELRATGNKQAKLRDIYILCFGDSNETPGFGYLGRVAKQVGGAGHLAEELFKLVPRPPTGDILAYILKAHKNRKSGSNGFGLANWRKENATDSDDRGTTETDDERELREQYAAFYAAQDAKARGISLPPL